MFESYYNNENGKFLKDHSGNTDNFVYNSPLDFACDGS